MGYIDQADYEARYSPEELTALIDRDNDGSPDYSVLAIAISDASNTVDSYLGGRYLTPLAEPSGMIKRVTTDLARHALHGDRVPEEVENRYKAALAFLRDVSAGRAVLAATQAVQANTDGEIAPSKSASDRIFTRDSLSGF